MEFRNVSSSAFPISVHRRRAAFRSCLPSLPCLIELRICPYRKFISPSLPSLQPPALHLPLHYPPSLPQSSPAPSSPSTPASQTLQQTHDCPRSPALSSHTPISNRWYSASSQESASSRLLSPLRTAPLLGERSLGCVIQWSQQASLPAHI